MMKNKKINKAISVVGLCSILLSGCAGKVEKCREDAVAVEGALARTMHEMYGSAGKGGVRYTGANFQSMFESCESDPTSNFGYRVPSRVSGGRTLIIDRDYVNR